MSDNPFALLGVVECPECHQLLDATDLTGLMDHAKTKHPEQLKRVALEQTLDAICETGLMRRSSV